MATIKQGAFVGGELDPGLHGRTDLRSYPASLRTCLNFMIRPAGSIQNRPGTRLVHETKSSGVARLIPFVFNQDDTFALELGDQYMRVHTIGATVESSPDVPYELVTPWAEADVMRLQYAQVNDILTVVHPNYQPQEIRRLADDDWELLPVVAGRTVQPPTTVNATGGGSTGDTKDWDWVVTAVNASGVESLPSIKKALTVILRTDETPVTVTWAAPGTGDTPVEYYVYRGRNEVYGYVGSSKTTSFDDDGYVPSWGDSPPEGRNPFFIEADVEFTNRFSGAWGGTPTLQESPKSESAEAFDDLYTFKYRVTVDAGESITVTCSTEPTDDAGYTIRDTSVFTGFKFGGAGTFQVSRVCQADGLVATANFKLQVTAVTGTPTMTPNGAVTWQEQSTGADQVNYPATVCYFEQRRCFGGFSQNPSQIITSRIGDFSNFDRSVPAKEDDGLDFTLASSKLDEIRALVPHDTLVAFTAGAEWPVQGVQGSPLTPSSFDAKPRTNDGSDWLQPVTVGRGALFAGAAGSGVSEFALDLQTGAVATRDLSIVSGHLFRGKTLVDWAYARQPDRCLWVVRSDGVLLGMTFVREQELWSWHRHTTDGTVESVCSVPEGTVNAVYVVVNRTINGSTKRYVERLHEWDQDDVEDAVFLDCSAEYDGWNTSSDAVKATGATYDPSDVVDLVATVGTPFVFGDIGKRIRLRTGTTTNDFHVTAFGSSTFLTAYCVTEVDAALQDTAVTDWARAVDEIDGLDHLEAKTVGILGDGAVLTQEAVSSGTISTLSAYVAKAQIGLPYNSDLETLPFSIPGDQGWQQPIRARRKTLIGMTVEVEESRALWTGQYIDDLREWDQRSVDLSYETSINPQSALVEVQVAGDWQSSAGAAVRQVDPLPLHILSLLPNFEVGE